MVFEIPVGDLFASRPPDARQRLRMFDELAQGADPVRPAGDVRVKADVHHAARRGPLFVEHVEFLDQRLRELVGREVLACDEREIVDLVRIGRRDDRALVRPQQVRLVVVHDVAVEGAAGLREDRGRVERPAQRGGKPSFCAPAGELLILLERAQDDVALLCGIAGKAGQQFALLPIVREQFPAALQHRIGHRLAPLERHRVRRAGGRNAELVEQVEQPPDPDALAIFAPAVIREVGHVPRQDVGQDRRSAGIIGLVGVLGQVPRLEIERQDQRDARAVRPFQRLPLGQGDVIIFHDWGLRA